MRWLSKSKPCLRAFFIVCEENSTFDLIILFTCGICYPWAIKMIYSWEQRHKIYCKRRCVFDGNVWQLFGTWILCVFLSAITLGIYTFWIPIKIKKWQIKHTHLLENDSLAEEKKELKLVRKELAAEERVAAIKKDANLKAASYVFAGITFLFMTMGCFSYNFSFVIYALGSAAVLFCLFIARQSLGIKKS